MDLSGSCFDKSSRGNPVISFLYYFLFMYSGNMFVFDLKVQLFWRLPFVKFAKCTCIEFVPAAPLSIQRNGRRTVAESAKFDNLILIGAADGTICSVNFGKVHVLH